MNTQAKIATRKVLAVDPSGREFNLTLGIGQPYEITPQEWACSVCMDGLYERLNDQHGADSWQALLLSYQLIAQLLTYFINDGGKLYWLESREPIVLSELVPQPKDWQ